MCRTARATAPSPTKSLTVRFAAYDAAKTTSPHGGRVFPLFLRRRRSILDLTARNVDHELGELGGIAWAFRALCSAWCEYAGRAVPLPEATELCLNQRSPLPKSPFA
jgi:hypothetical protein